MGWVFSVFSVSSLAASACASAMTKKLGYKKFVSLSVLLTAAGNVLYALPPAVPGSGAKYLLLAGRLVAGAGTGAISAANDYIGSVETERNKQKALSIARRFGFLGLFVGPAVSAVFSASLPSPATQGLHLYVNMYTAGPLAVAVLCLPVSVAVLCAFKRPAHGPQAHTGVKKQYFVTPMAAVFLLAFVSAFTMSAFQTYITKFTAVELQFTVTNNSVLFLAMSVALVPGLVCAFGLSRCVGERATALAGMLVLVVGLSLDWRFGSSADKLDSYALFCGSTALLVLGYTVVVVINRTIFSQMLPLQNRSLQMQTIAGVGALARIPAPLLAGYMYENVGASYTKVALVSLCVVSAAVWLWYFRGLGPYSISSEVVEEQPHRFGRAGSLNSTVNLWDSEDHSSSLDPVLGRLTSFGSMDR